MDLFKFCSYINCPKCSKSLELNIAATRRARNMFFVFVWTALFLVYAWESIVQAGERHKGLKCESPAPCGRLDRTGVVLLSTQNLFFKGHQKWKKNIYFHELFSKNPWKIKVLSLDICLNIPGLEITKKNGTDFC